MLADHVYAHSASTDILYYIARTGYNEGAYGADIYSCNGADDINCQETEGGSSTILPPVTGYYRENPVMLVPTILGLSLMIATAILAVKLLIRKKKARKEMV